MGTLIQQCINSSSQLVLNKSLIKFSLPTPEENRKVLGILRLS